jgi:hypothetical protein
MSQKNSLLWDKILTYKVPEKARLNEQRFPTCKRNAAAEHPHRGGWYTHTHTHTHTQHPHNTGQGLGLLRQVPRPAWVGHLVC